MKIRIFTFFSSPCLYSDPDLSFILNSLSLELVMLQIGWRVVFLLALPVFVISGKDGLELDENTENSLHREDGLDVEMCSNGDKGSQLGFGWNLVSVKEREGKCPGTREKVKEVIKR